MYHYVRDYDKSGVLPLKGVDVKDFASQVRSLKSRFTMLTPADLLAFVRGEDSLPEGDSCLLTFDDGLSDHYQYVAPELADQNVSGIFFVPTSATSRDRLLFVHKNHYLLAQLGFQTYQKVILDGCQHFGIDVEVESDEATLRRVYRWDDLPTASVKYLVNYQLDSENKQKVIDHAFDRAIGNEKQIAMEFYASWSELSEMQQSGLGVGGHSHSHNELSSMSFDDLSTDLRTCRSVLSSHLGQGATTMFSYPYGKRKSFNQDVKDILNREGFECAFCTEVGSNTLEADQWELKRVDPKDLTSL